MLSRLATRSLRTSVTWLQGTPPVHVNAPDASPSFVPLPETSNGTVKCTSEVPVAESPSINDFRQLASSSIDAEETHADASGDESEGEDTVHSDGLDARTREQYVVKEARKRLAAEGAAPVSKKALDSLERHLLTRSGVRSSMAPLSISIFNFHSQDFAQRLLDRSVGNLVLVESALEHAMKAKDFSRAARRKGNRIEAFHADATALFGLDRRKKEEKQRGFRKKKVPLFSFPDQLVARPSDDNEDGTVMPLRLRRRDSRSLTTVISPIIVCPLGSHTQSATILDVFLHRLLQHHLNIDEKGLFTLGDVELLTYLHSEQAAHLLSSSVPSLSFISHAARRRSQLMHTLFEIGHLDYAVSSSSFSPPNLPPSKKMAHEKKMKEAGFRASRWFGCWLRPRSTVSIGGREIIPGVEEEELDSLMDEKVARTLPPSVLLPYAVWCEALGKLPATKKAVDVISTLIPGSASSVRSIIPPGAKIGEVTAEDADAVFVEARAELNESPEVHKYHEKHLMKNEDKLNFAD